jgi:hypothetical protein
MKRSSRARRLRAADDALHLAWEARRGWERQKGAGFQGGEK